LVTFFDSIDYYEMVEDMYDSIDEYIKKAIDFRMDAGDRSGEDPLDVFRMIRDIDRGDLHQYGKKN